MIEAAAHAAADYTWQRVAVSVLTVVAFALASGGLLHAFLSTARIAQRVERVQATRRRITQALSVEMERIAALDPALEDLAALQTAANRKFHDDHAAAGIVPWGYQESDYGAEPVAESLVRELSSGTRADLWIAGAGLLLGLAASLWGTWIP